jgi:FkbM family methyltransferase
MEYVVLMILKLRFNDYRMSSMVSSRYGNMQTIETDSIVSESYRLYGEWAQLEIDIMLRFIRPGMRVIDGGAFIGGHTLAFANQVGPTGKVFSFEPRTSVFKILEDNIRINRLSQAQPFAFGLDSENRSVAVEQDEAVFNAGGFSIAQSTKSTSSTLNSISCVEIDSLNLGHIDFIKLDIEGMEADAMLGAREAIKQSKPVIFCEVNSLESGSKLLNLGHDLEYDLFQVLAGAFNPNNYKHCSKNIFNDAKELCLIFIPKLKTQAIEDALALGDIYPVASIDELSLSLLNKPQYHQEVLEKLPLAQHLTLRYRNHYVQDIEARLTDTLLNFQESPITDLASGASNPQVHPAGESIIEIEKLLGFQNNRLQTIEHNHRLAIELHANFTQETHGKLEAFATNLREKTEQIEQLTFENANLRKETERQMSQIAQLVEQCHQFELQSNQNMAQLTDARHIIERKEIAHKVLMNSYSMRLTAPLRWIARKLFSLY